MSEFSRRASAVIPATVRKRRPKSPNSIEGRPVFVDRARCGPPAYPAALMSGETRRICASPDWPLETMMLVTTCRSLMGDYAGFFSIRINGQYRIVFRFERSDARDVQIVDYH